MLKDRNRYFSLDYKNKIREYRKDLIKEEHKEEYINYLNTIIYNMHNGGYRTGTGGLVIGSYTNWIYEKDILPVLWWCEENKINYWYFVGGFGRFLNILDKVAQYTNNNVVEIVEVDDPNLTDDQIPALKIDIRKIEK